MLVLSSPKNPLSISRTDLKPFYAGLNLMIHISKKRALENWALENCARDPVKRALFKRRLMILSVLWGRILQRWRNEESGWIHYRIKQVSSLLALCPGLGACLVYFADCCYLLQTPLPSLLKDSVEVQTESARQVCFCVFFVRGWAINGLVFFNFLQNMW